MSEKIEGFYLDGTKYEIGGGAEYNAGQGISIGEGQICTEESDRKGPAPSGFHVPSIDEWLGVKTIMDNLSSSGDDWRINLHMPFTGYRSYSSAGLSDQSYGFYWSSSHNESSSYDEARSLYMTSSYVMTLSYGRANGLSVRCFKNEYIVPDSTWLVIKGTLGSAGIFWNQTDGIISITSNGTTGYTIMDKNLGATTVYNNGDTLSEANCGKYYQWGNNHGFSRTGSVTTSSTKVDASVYGPTNPYSSGTFITTNDENRDWASAYNNNLRGDTSNGTHQECGGTIDNVISNTGVLSVNGQTGNITVQSGSEASGITTTQPSNPVAGSTYYDTTAGTLKVYNGTAWVEVGGGNVIAMTQAQYDALPEATKNDGKLRIITDATGIEMADKAYVDGLVGDIETLLAAL